MILPSGELASASADTTIKLWNVQTGTCIRTFSGDASLVHVLTVLPGGELASASLDNTIKIWNIQTGACIWTISSPCLVRALVILPSGELLAGNSDLFNQTIKLWDLGFRAGSTSTHTKSATSTSLEDNQKSPNPEGKHVKEIKETKSSGRMLHSLKKDIHTLFRQGYRFSTERPGDNTEKLNVCVEYRPKSTDGHSELEMAQAKFVNIIFNQPTCLSGVYNEEKRQFLVKGQLPFIEQMDKELKNITAEYEQETGIKGCTMS